jgi:hypothetical protein
MEYDCFFGKIALQANLRSKGKTMRLKHKDFGNLRLIDHWSGWKGERWGAFWTEVGQVNLRLSEVIVVI